MPEKYDAGFYCALILLLASTVFSCLCGSFWKPNQDKSLSITWQAPFQKWGDVQTFFNISSYDRAQASQLQTTLFNVSWCLTPAIRPYQTPANRSRACSCLNQTWYQFLNETGGLSGSGVVTVKDETRSKTQSSALNCMNQRAVWRVYETDSNWHVHPLVIAFYLNISMLLWCLVYFLSRWTDLNALIVLAVTLVLGGTASILFFFSNQMGGGIPALGLLSNIILGVLLNPLLKTDGPGSPPTFMICMWCWFVAALPAVYAQVAVVHTLRDYVGLGILSLLGYIFGITAQRLFWCKWYVRNETGEPLGDEVVYMVRELTSSVLSLGALFQITAGGILLSTIWHANSPYTNSTWSVVALAFLWVAVVFEIANRRMTPASFGVLEILQCSFFGAAVAIVSSVALDDAIKIS